MSAETSPGTMPYIGLRPFRREDADLFFGREDQVDNLLDRLESHRFLAVVGTSGCGKSSLVRAGLIPDLENGFMAEAGEDWQIATLLPGNEPIDNLAEALVKSGALGESYANLEDGAHVAAAILRRGPSGLVELLDETSPAKNTNLLIIVDQFEEIFRFRRLGDPAAAAGFVNLLLNAAASRKHPIYVVMTMRSDYLGDCAVFPGLPEALNDAQFLVPRLSRDQLETAITGPAALFDADVDEALLNQLLNELGSDPDQLPLMQHALMRMWDHQPLDEDEDEGGGRILDQELYLDIGGLSQALSLHVTSVTKDLTWEKPQQERERKSRIVQVLFRCLCDVTSGRDDIRRPAVLSEVAAVAAATPEEVMEVVEAFRTPTCSFIMPPAGVPLSPDTVLDIAHESLIRNWDDLRSWRGAEAHWREEYDRLVQSARRWRDGKAALSTSPELDAQITWRRTPTIGPAWALRYGSEEDFSLAEEYLEKSAIAEEERKEEKERSARVKYWTVVSVTVVLIVALLFALEMWRQTGNLVDDRDTAITERDRAKIELNTAREDLEGLRVQKREFNNDIDNSKATLESLSLTIQSDTTKLNNQNHLLSIQRTKLSKLQSSLIEANTQLKQAKEHLKKSNLEAENRIKEAEEVVKRTLLHAEGLKRLTEATIAAADPGPDLVTAGVLILQARQDNSLDVNNHSAMTILNTIQERLMKVHLVRNSPEATTHAQELGQGHILLATKKGRLELLDIEKNELRVIKQLQSKEEPSKIRPGPTKDSAIVLAGSRSFLVNTNGEVLDLKTDGPVGTSVHEGRILIWSSGNQQWHIRSGLHDADLVQGDLPECELAGPNAAAIRDTGCFAVCDDGSFWGLHTGKKPHKNRGPGKELQEAWVAPGGDRWILLTKEGHLHLHIRGGKQIRPLRGSTILAVSCNWEDGFILAADNEDRLYLLDTNGRQVAIYQMSSWDQGGIRPEYTDGLTPWSDIYGSVHVLDWGPVREIGQAPLDTFPVTASLTKTGSNSFLWITDEEGGFTGWTVEPERNIRELSAESSPEETDEAEEITSPTNKVVSGDQLVIAWSSLSKETQSWLTNLPVEASILAPGGELMVVKTLASRLLLINLKTRKVKTIGITDSLAPSSFSTDSRRFACAGSTSGIRVWDDRGTQLRLLPWSSPVKKLNLRGANDPIHFESSGKRWEWHETSISDEEAASIICGRLPRRHVDRGPFDSEIPATDICAEYNLTQISPLPITTGKKTHVGQKEPPHPKDSAPPLHMAH